MYNNYVIVNFENEGGRILAILLLIFMSVAFSPLLLYLFKNKELGLVKYLASHTPLLAWRGVLKEHNFYHFNFRYTQLHLSVMPIEISVVQRYDFEMIVGVMVSEPSQNSA